MWYIDQLQYKIDPYDSRSILFDDLPIDLITYLELSVLNTKSGKRLPTHSFKATGYSETGLTEIIFDNVKDATEALNVLNASKKNF